MQTQAPPFHHSVAHKKGFALILTLSALSVIIALTAVLISYLDEARKESSAAKAMIQANLYYADIEQIFKGFKDKKVLYKTLYLSPLPLISDDGRFSVVVECKPLANAVNINWLSRGNDLNMSQQFSAAQKVFDVLAQKYELEDASLLEEMLLEEIGGTNQYVIREQSKLRQKSGILSFKQFSDILDRYQRASDDQKVGQIPWKNYFSFTQSSKNSDENLIDGDYLSAELIAALFDIDLATVKDEWIAGSVDLKTFMQNIGATYEQDLFSKEFLAQSKCEIQFDYEGERFAFGFEDSEGEVKHFEFFGKQ